MAKDLPDEHAPGYIEGLGAWRTSMWPKYNFMSDDMKLRSLLWVVYVVSVLCAVLGGM